MIKLLNDVKNWLFNTPSTKLIISRTEHICHMNRCEMGNFKNQIDGCKEFSKELSHFSEQSFGFYLLLVQYGLRANFFNLK